MTSQDSADLNTAVPSDGDRLTTSTFNLNVKAGLVSKDVENQPSTGKRVTSYSIKFGTTIVNDINEI